MAKTKDQYEDIGVVKKIDINGMAVFDMPLLNAKKQTTKNTEEMKLALKCEVGDRVVKEKGKRVYLVIPASEWNAMPATEEEATINSAAAATPQLTDITARLAALESESAALRAENDALQAKINAGTNA